MSIHLLARVWKTDMPDPQTKLLLLKLADNANDEGVCWPSLQRIERETGLSKTTICKKLKALEGAGIIERRTGGVNKNTVYFLKLPSEGSAPRAQGGSAPDAQPSAPDALGVVRPAHTNRQAEPSSNRQEDTEGAIGEFPKAAIRETWNRLVPSLTKITGINGKRERAMHARWQAIGDLASWEQFCIRVEASDFMTGRQAGTDGRKWTATFDWCIIPGNFDKVVEGRYDNQKPNPKDKNGNKSWMF